MSAVSLFDSVKAVARIHHSSFSERAATHARGSAEGSQGCREDADDDLNDGLPSFFLHSALMCVFRG